MFWLSLIIFTDQALVVNKEAGLIFYVSEHTVV